MPNASAKPNIVVDSPLSDSLRRMLSERCELLPWSATEQGTHESVTGIYTFGHPHLDGSMMDHFPELKVISNFGVGVDHINVADAISRDIPVGNTPGVLDGATADMAFALLMAAGRKVVAGDRYARSREFTVYDPGYILGREIHSQTLGIIGLGRIGYQIARRAIGFDMRVMYHNRHRHENAEQQIGVQYATFDELLQQSDYVVISVPLNDETRGMIDAIALNQMKSTAILINIGRGPLVDTEAITTALQQKRIYAAALDVTDPEPLPRDHPLLALDNVTLTPHLGSATEQTRHRMAELSIENLMCGLTDKALIHEVTP